MTKSDDLSVTSKYFLDKLFMSYIFSNDIKWNLQHFDDESCIYDNDALLKFLENIVDENDELFFLDDFVKNNIREILIFLRESNIYKQRNDYTDIVIRINNMIVKLNTSALTNVSDFYYEELLKYNDLSPYLINKIKQGKLVLIPEIIRQTIATDIWVLILLKMDDECYRANLEDYLDDEYIVSSLRKIINEKPDIFLDDMIYERVAEILEYNLSYVMEFFYNHQFYRNNLTTYKQLRKLRKR